MECPTSITNLLNYGVLPEKWSDLSVLLNETIISLEQLLLSSNLKELSIDVKEDYPFSSDRNAVMEKTKLSVISETLDSLKLLYNNFERWNNIDIQSAFLYHGRNIDCWIKTKIQQLVNNCKDTIDSLNDNAKSPYDLEAILDPDYFKQSLKIYPSNDLHDRARLFIGLAQSELGIIKESPVTNEMQKVILTFYLDKLKTLNDQITSSSLVTKPSSFKKKSKSSKFNEINKICEIMRKCQRLIKDFYGLIQILTFKDYFNEKDEIFIVINEKGRDAASEVCKFIESIKTEWIKKDCANITRATCRSSALRRLNITLKLTKKLDSYKDDLESSYIILGLKNIATEILNINVLFGTVSRGAYYLTFKGLPKPRVDVPPNFIRNDPVYEEIYEKPYNALFIVYFHIFAYYQFLESLDWNPFQNRKPRKLTDYLWNIQSLIEDALNAGFNQDELYKISLDLADRYLLTKQKIHYDRETLEYRFDNFKPLKPHKFPEIYSKINSKRRNRWDLEVLVSKFDGLIGGTKSAMAMMKRSIYLFKIIRRDLTPADKFNRLTEQASNEYFYAAEIAVKLLDLLRPNRRRFMETVNSQMKNLKIQIRDKEADLESVKHEKTQLKYLQSILNRSKLIPIAELEMTDKDNIEILREIIEEYEFTITNYGPVESITLLRYYSLPNMGVPLLQNINQIEIFLTWNHPKISWIEIFPLCLSEVDWSSKKKVLAEWHDQVNGKVQKLIKEDFPRKVLALNDFLAEEYFDEKYIKGIHQEMIILQSRVGLPNDLHMNLDTVKDNATTTTSKGKEIKAASIESTESQEETDHKKAIIVPVNNKIKTISNLVKPKMKEFLADLNLIKLWIQLLMPKIEDGNNFGVEIQEEILAEVRFAFSDGLIYYNSMIRYHNTRAGIVKKIEKCPFIEDYQEYLAVFDEDEWIGLKSTVIKMRNHYDRLHSLMTKNWEKLICPRASNSDTMF
uniref:Uncharacterized protein n=1 Tax=Tetranychus urticae TaxID=32264 RepID=T1JYH4_TETUR